MARCSAGPQATSCAAKARAGRRALQLWVRIRQDSLPSGRATASLHAIM